MKKIILIIITVVTMLGISACGDKQSNQSTVTDDYRYSSYTYDDNAPLYGVGRRGQRLSVTRAFRLVADAAQLRRRLPVGTEKTGERAPRLRIRQENERFPAEHQRGFLREFV